VVESAVPRYVIAIAASAGGVEALRGLVTRLPADLPAAVCVMLHLPSTGRSLLAPILDRGSPLATMLACDGARLTAGTILVAAADHHLLIGPGTVALGHGPKENGVRPAADPMFRSLAHSWGERGVAVVLSGALGDGAAGAAAVARAGGRVLVQDPADAIVPGMPQSAIAAVGSATVLPVLELAGALVRLAETPAPAPASSTRSTA
jgi:two-component system, chemotaxis family, protein-glutamate methylesterase/glutaminase